MSDSKRNRKSNQNREQKRTILLAKKEDKDSNAPKATDKPKILLKTKEKDSSTQVNHAPAQISIATRPPTAEQNASHESKSSKTASTTAATTTTSKDAKESNSIQIASHDSHETKTPTMKRPIQVISDYYQTVSSAFDHMIETNTDFFVVGIVGTQGSGKSSILNMLIDDEADLFEIDDEQRLEEILAGRRGLFKTRSHTKEAAFSTMPTTEGIQMYVTRHRTILLDCSPVLCNPYKKDGILNELDDLKMLIFMLSVCHLVILVEDNGFNMHLLRLLQMAENMKIDCHEKDTSTADRTTNVLLFKNKCQNRDFSPEAKERTNKLYRTFFRDSKLNIFTRSTLFSNDFNRKKIAVDEDFLNIVYFPMVDAHKGEKYMAHPDLSLLIAEFRQRVFMSSRTPFLQNQQQNSFTEKHWSHLALAVWESHKNNYFLRKFETFKDKEWPLRV